VRCEFWMSPLALSMIQGEAASATRATPALRSSLTGPPVRSSRSRTIKLSALTAQWWSTRPHPAKSHFPQRVGTPRPRPAIPLSASSLLRPAVLEVERFASMVGKTTVRRHSTSHQSGYTKEAVNLSSNVSDSYEGVDLITTDLLMAM
jgi:TraM recognition site of TraD and TraG